MESRLSNRILTQPNGAQDAQHDFGNPGCVIGLKIYTLPSIIPFLSAVEYPTKFSQLREVHFEIA